MNPGDTVRMSAYGMYRNDVGEETGVINTLISALAGSFTGAPGLEAAELVNEFAQLPAAITGAGVAGQGNVPKAYLKYIIFDKDFNVVNVTIDDTDVDELTAAAHNGWEKLHMEVPITKNGYIYIYVANESVADVDVHFDDVEVTLIEGPMTSASDYYPFGLVMDGRSWTSEPYRFGYQGQFAEKDEETSWNYFEARMWNSEIGRWLIPDPMRQYYSPYLGMGNAPTYKFDPDGRCDECPDPKTMEIGSTYIFDSEGPHAGAEYTLTSDGWVRTDLPMMDGLTVEGSPMGYYEAKMYDAQGFGQTWNAFFSRADGWWYGRHEYDRNGKPNGFQKVVAGLNPVISVWNGASVLYNEKSIYNEPAEHAIDKTFAVIDIVTPFNPGKNLLKNSVGNVIDVTLNVAGSVEDSGAIDGLKK